MIDSRVCSPKNEIVEAIEGVGVPPARAFPVQPLLSLLTTDVQTAQKRDVSVSSLLETLFCSTGLHALLAYRIAHTLYHWQIPLLPRLISQIARFLTGIEIHPGAQIAEGVFIVSGSGVVIGETAIIGAGSLIYESVTLGGTGKETGKRHPTLGENVIVGAGAKVLGNIYIGNGTRIGAGAVVLKDIPDRSLVAGIPGRIIPSLVQSLEDWQPDWEAQVIQKLFERIQQLEAEVDRLHSNRGTKKQYTPSLESQRIIEEFLDGSGI